MSQTDDFLGVSRYEIIEGEVPTVESDESIDLPPSFGQGDCIGRLRSQPEFNVDEFAATTSHRWRKFWTHDLPASQPDSSGKCHVLLRYQV